MSAALLLLAGAVEASAATDPLLPASDRRGEAREASLAGVPILPFEDVRAGASPLAAAWLARGPAAGLSLAALTGTDVVQEGTLAAGGASGGGSFVLRSSGLRGASGSARVHDLTVAGGGRAGRLAVGAAGRSAVADRGVARSSVFGFDFGAGAALWESRDPRRTPRLFAAFQARSLGYAGPASDADPAEAAVSMQLRTTGDPAGPAQVHVGASLGRIVDRSAPFAGRAALSASFRLSDSRPLALSVRIGSDFVGAAAGVGLRAGTFTFDVAASGRPGTGPSFALSAGLSRLAAGAIREEASASSESVERWRAAIVRAAEEAERRGDELEAFALWRSVAGSERARNRAAQALSRLSARCAVDPEAHAAFAEAAAAYANGNRDEAATRWRRIAGKNPAIDELARRAQGRAGRPEPAEAGTAGGPVAVPTLSAEAKTRFESLYQQGLAHYASGRYKEAEGAWREAAALDPANGDVRRDLERLSLRLKALERKP